MIVHQTKIKKVMWIQTCWILCVAVLECGFTGAASSCGCHTSRALVSSNGGWAALLSTPVHNESLDQCPVWAGDGDTEDEDDWVLVPAGEYQFGTDEVAIPGDREGPARVVALSSFYLHKYEVSNARFTEFVRASSYRTEAESYGDSFVFALQLNASQREDLRDMRAAAAPWWYKVNGANWQHPAGPGSTLAGRWSHPVVHVSWRDAVAYCAWKGARLPSEVEWEGACRAGARHTRFPWGDQLYPQRTHMANIWQGQFPGVNSGRDGFVDTCPVHLFPQNSLNLHSMVGNVWEWVHDSWHHRSDEEKVKKGGSFLCHRSYCYRYRCSARAHNTRDSSAANLGFRCAKDVSRHRTSHVASDRN